MLYNILKLIENNHDSTICGTVEWESLFCKKCMKLYNIFSSFHIRLKLIIYKTIFFYRSIFLNAQCTYAKC